MRDLTLRHMEYYSDRARIQKCTEIADNLLNGRVYLWRDVYFEPTAENMFDSVFETTDRTYREYIFAMDYLSALLSAYQKTGNCRYREKFLDVVCQFFDHYDRGLFIPLPDDDLSVYAQTLMFIKSFSIIPYEEPLRTKIADLLYQYAQYCYDDKNYCDHMNHGLFTDLALLHLSVLFEALPEAKDWKSHALERVRKLFSVCFYEDGVNNEGSLSYFWHNLVQYQRIIDFCDAYQISGVDPIRQRLEHARQVVFRSFAHSDGSFPLIGDGQEFLSPVGHDDVSALYPDGGICVVKTGGMYLTFKCGSTMQAHTHVDDSSITARFRDIDLALDPGQFNYDRYHPINRFLRTSGGHSGIFPISVDGLSLKEYLGRRGGTEIGRFEFDGTAGLISGGYELDGGGIKVRREIKVGPERIEIRDSWSCASPQTMRQRFVLPKGFLERSHFTASKRLFETTIRQTAVQYEIASSDTPIVTTVNFGVCSKKYLEYEPTVLLDTVAENSLGGEITAIISVYEKGGAAPCSISKME